ncbi:MAG: hypothetical protein ACK5SI_17525 [Planctomycetia bacterium]
MTRSAPPLLVTIDRLPAWMLPAYGCSWVAMPALDDFAGRGVVFDRVIATVDDAHETLGQLAGWLAAARAEGLEMTLVSDDAAVAGGPLAASVATVRLVEARPTAACAATVEETSLGRLFAVAAEMLASRPQAGLWCHVAGLGVAWDAPEEFRDAYVDPEDPPPPAGAAVPDFAVASDTDPALLVGVRQAFAGQLTMLDRCLGALLALPAARDRAVLVAGIRGLPLGLHGRVGPGPLPPYGELVHLPAILVDASGRMAAQRYGGLVTPADLGATLGDLVAGGAPSAAAAQARSLAGLFDSWSSPARDRVIVGGSAGGAVVTAGWLLVAPRPPTGPRPAARLFHKPDDFFDLCDVADRCPAVAEELLGVWDAFEQGDEPRAMSQPLSPPARGAG